MVVVSVALDGVDGVYRRLYARTPSYVIQSTHLPSAAACVGGQRSEVGARPATSVYGSGREWRLQAPRSGSADRRIAGSPRVACPFPGMRRERGQGTGGLFENG